MERKISEKKEEAVERRAGMGYSAAKKKLAASSRSGKSGRGRMKAKRK
jgi:hypothetical protein